MSLSKAAELPDCSVWEFADLIEEADATWVSGDYLKDDLDEL